MGFEVPAEAYQRFMGRYSAPLADRFAASVGVRPGQRVLDVGCGPGALTSVVAGVVGAGSVVAIDPSASFVKAVHARLPGVEVHTGVAEQLPFDDDVFDVALAQLVVHFMTDRIAGVREMARVTRPDGVVAACVWDDPSGEGPLATLWRGVQAVDPGHDGDALLPGVRPGELAQLCEDAGLRDVHEEALTVSSTFASFDDWWEPYTFGIGPAGAYVQGLTDELRGELRHRCAALLPPYGPFELSARARSAQGRTP